MEEFNETYQETDKIEGSAEDSVESDEMSPEEAAFQKGYDEADEADEPKEAKDEDEDEENL